MVSETHLAGGGVERGWTTGVGGGGFPEWRLVSRDWNGTQVPALWTIWGRGVLAEGAASVKVLRQESVWCIREQLQPVWLEPWRMRLEGGQGEGLGKCLLPSGYWKKQRLKRRK